MRKFNAKSTMKEKRERAMKFLLGCTFRVCLLVFVLVLGVCHIRQMSENATEGYAVGNLQSELEMLSQEVETVESEIALNQSMTSVKERLAGMNFVSADQISYLDGSGSLAVLDR
ncbi:hypothetical protein H6758_02730 [Candidatus Nomurabacteria bacterium]|nr:hypothetical protein [Candidatus Nomurabacteria bacterium]